MRYARLILALCDRWHQLPSAVRREDASVLALLDIERLTRPEGGDEYG